MNQTEIISSIETVLVGLFNLNDELFEHWYSVLYDENERMNIEEWCEHTLKLMENDVLSMDEE